MEFLSHPAWRGIGVAAVGAVLWLAAGIGPASAGDDEAPGIDIAQLREVEQTYSIPEELAAQLIKVAQGERLTVADAWKMEQQDNSIAALTEFVHANDDQFGGIWASREDVPTLHYHVGYLPGAPLHQERKRGTCI